MTARASDGEPSVPVEGTGRRWFVPSWIRTLALQVGTLVAFLAVWEGLTAGGLIAEFLIPRASDVLVVLWQDVVEIFTGGPMQLHFMTTLIEIVLGFVGSAVVGVAVGALLAEFEPLRRAMYPYVVAVNATPRIAFAPLFVIWFGFDHLSKIVMAIAIAAFPVLVNTLAGLSATDADDLRLMRSLGATRGQIMRRVRIPTALPYLFAGFETAMLFSAVGAVVGEFMGGNRGLGYVTLLAQELFRLDEAFAAIVLLGIQGFLLHRLVVMARRKFVFWQSDQDAPTGQ